MIVCDVLSTSVSSFDTHWTSALLIMDKRHGGCVGEHMSPTYSFFPVVSFNHNLSQPKPTKRERKYVEGKEVGEETLKKKMQKI